MSYNLNSSQPLISTMSIENSNIETTTTTKQATTKRSLKKG